MPDRVYNVLFLCTGNSARSILAESILQRDGGAHFRAFSAGSQPRGAVHPLALKVLADGHYPATGFRSKSWEEFAQPGAPAMDFVFTVCDDAAGETCPVWPGQPITAHWGIPDPAAVEGPDWQKEATFVAAFRALRSLIGVFTALPLAGINSMSLQTKLREMGRASRTVFYHNPDCGTSRNALALLRSCGVAPDVIEYLKAPPSKERLRELVALMGLTTRELLRHHPKLFAELALNSAARSDEDILDAMVAHPILINRPIVVTPTTVKLCRPSETVLDLVPSDQVPASDMLKDDNTPFVRDEPFPANDDLAYHLEAARLPVDDLKEPGRTFYRYSLLGGQTVGFGGFELYGTDVLTRSLCVMPQFHGRGIGRNMMLLLLRRAFDQGARRAYAFADTPEARAFNEALRFVAIPRADAPASILATRQATGLCALSATLLTRAITL